MASGDSALSDLKVAVVGGSIGGLTAANVLRDLGCQVDVYERSHRTLVGFGNGIVAQPELMRYFVERTDTDPNAITVASTTMQYFDATTAELLGSIDADWRFTSYDALYRGLLGAFGEERYHLGFALKRIEHDPEDPAAGVALHFEKGEERHYDLAVCCDGGGSTARRQLLDVSPSYAGYISWRSLARREALDTDTWDFFDDAFTYGLLDDGHVIAYPIPLLGEDLTLEGAQINFQWYWNVEEGAALDDIMTCREGTRRPTSVHPAVMQPRWIRKLHEEAAERLAGPFAELIGSGRDPFVTIIADAAVPRLVFGRTVLLGDAGFSPRPHAAAGAAQAAANAWDLGVALANRPTDPDAALADWEPAQLQRGEALIAKVRHMASILQSGGDFVPGDPACRFGLPA